MKLSVLSDNRAKEGFHSEHGLSFFIENEGITLLFDTGASDILLKNAEKLGINIEIANIIVLSHGHFDHGDGLRYLKDKTLICHTGCFIQRYRKNGFSNIGLCLAKEEILKKFTLKQSDKPYQVFENIIFLGEIPRINDFEAQTTDFITKGGIKDYVIDDSALAVKSKNGLIVVSGCSHSGICNITEYAKQVTGCNNVYAVIGGFHLKSDSEQTRKTIEYFKKERIHNVYPSHCTIEPALGMFHKEFGTPDVKAGAEIIL